MFKTTLLFGLFLLTTSLAVAQPIKGQVDASKVPGPSHHYQEEYTLDLPSNPTAWTNVRAGLNVSFATTSELYLRREVPALRVSQSWQDTGWRGERLHTQILVWSPDPLGQIRFHVGDLEDGKGNVLGKENVTLSMVRYVLSNFPYGAKALGCGSGT